MSKIPPKSKKFDMGKKKRKEDKRQKSNSQKNKEENEFGKIILDFPSHIFRFKKEKNGKITVVLSEGTLAKKLKLRTKLIKGKYLKDIFPDKKEYSIAKSYYDKAFSGEKLQYKIKLNGSWFRTIIQPFKKDSNGNVVEILGYSEDITTQKEVEDQIKEDHNKLISIFDGIDEAIYVSDVDTYELLYMNRHMKNIFGDSIGKKCYKVFQKRSRPCPFCTNDIIKENKNKPYTWEFKNEVNNRWYRCIDRLILWPDGRVVRFEMAIDITAVKNAQSKLKENEERYYGIFEGVNDALFLHDITTGEILSVNKKACEMYGYSIDEFKDISINDITAEDQICNMKIFKKGLKEINEGSMNPIQWHAKNKKGNLFWVELNPTVLSINGKDRLLVSIRDITVRKQAEEALRNSEEQYRLLVESVPVLVSAIDSSGKYIMWNDHAEKMLGYKSNEVIGKLTPNSFVESAKKLEEMLEEARVKGLYNQETVLFNKNKQPIPSHLIVVPYRDSKGKILRYYGLAEDITKRKKVEQDLQDLNQTLEKKIKDRTEELERARNESEIAKNNLQKIVDNASELIFSFDKINRIVTWGKKVEQITGVARKKIIGKNIQKSQVFENAEEIIDNISRIAQNKPPKSNLIVLNTKNGSRRVIKTSFSPIKKEKIYDGVILIGNDITLEIESHGRFIKGYSYYSLSEKNDSILDLFQNLVELHGKKGLFITRSNPEHIKHFIGFKKITTIYLKQKSVKGIENGSDLDKIIRNVKSFINQNKNSIVLLDRADYLISNYGFENFIKHLYQITDIISENNSMFLLYVNPSFFDKKQLSLITSELIAVPGQQLEEIQIKDDYYEILKLVNKYNANNMLVEFKKISDDLSINRKTLSKKINNLENQGLIITERHGRSKTPYLTDKAKSLLNK